MITEKINNGLIEAMRNKIPEGTNLAHLLMDILSIGKEAVYRRLRSEVPFTLAEASVISGRLGISLDNLMGANFGNNAIFDLNMVDAGNPAGTYSKLLERYLKVMSVMTREKHSETAASTNLIPKMFYMRYEGLSKFRLFKWIYQNGKTEAVKSYDDVILPEKLASLQDEFVRVTQDFRQTSFVWDSMMFMSIVNDIKYFEGIQLISKEATEGLKHELLLLIDELEATASKGAYRNGNEINIYLSNINFEAGYGYVESDSYFISTFRVYSINSFTSKDPEVFATMKNWIQSLKKFSILISQSGEMQRIHFFNRQREIVETL